MFSYFRGAEELMAQQEPEEYPVQTDTPCPTCGRLVEWSGYNLYCEPCGAAWDNFAELQSDIAHARREACLLYTYDAADDLPRVVPGGRRLITKKNN